MVLTSIGSSTVWLIRGPFSRSVAAGRSSAAGASIAVIGGKPGEGARMGAGSVLASARQPPRDGVELLEARGILAPAAIVHQGRPGGVLAGLADRAGDQAHRGDDDLVAYFQVAQHAGATADEAIAADARTAGGGRASGHRRV